jgi:transaldolase
MQVRSHFSLVRVFSLLTSSAGVAVKADPIPKVSYIDDEPNFRWALLQEQMAFDKLHEGIKKFAEDGETLKSLLKAKLVA